MFFIKKAKKEKYSFEEAEKRFGISVRKLAFLIRNNLLEPIVEGGSLFIPHVELEDYIKLPKKIRHHYHVSYLKTLGPGLVTGASDDDPSGIATYANVGFNYGLKLSWFAVYLLPMMIAVQETVARIGIVTNKGLAGAIGKYYGKKILYPLVFLLLIANTVNIGVNIGAMVASLQLLLPINFYLGVFLMTMFMIFLVIKMPYHKYAKFLKWLTISLVAYIVTGFIVSPDWSEVFKSLAIPSIEFNLGFLSAMVAVMGTTITPYLFFWQASEEIEKKKEEGTFSDHRFIAIKKEIKEMRKDTFFGMSLSNLVFLFIVITTAWLFYRQGITNLESIEDIAGALKPLAGDFAYIIFTLGILGVGLLAVPVLAGSSAYAVSELLKWNNGLNKKFKEAKGFYLVIIVSMIFGMLLNIFNFNPVKSLYYAAILNGIISPILMFFIFKMGRDKKIMGRFTSPLWVNFWGYLATFFMGICAILLIVYLFV